MSAKKAWSPRCTQDDVRSKDIAQIFTTSSEQLFSPSDGLFEVEVAEVTSQASESQLEEHVSKHHSFPPTSNFEEGQDEAKKAFQASFFLLEPVYGWSHLPITHSGATKLFSALRVFPQIYRHKAAFGEKRFPRDEGFAGFDSETRVGSTGSLSSFECSYLLKYIEKRDDARPGSNPWSIRHALIYQKVSHEESELSHILIRLPLAVKKLLGSSVLNRSGESSNFVEDWTNLHITCFSSVDHNLHQFINYLDEEVDKLFKRVIMAGVEPDKLNEFDTLSSTTSDFKSLQYLSDQLRRVINVIQLNILTLECFQKQIRDLETLPFQTASQLRDTVSMRNGEFNKTSTAMTSRNTSAIVHLSDKSSREARVVKTLTVLAMVFVPAAFTADFIQMGFVTITQESPMKWSADPDLKIYAILAIPLITITMLIYMLVEFVQRVREKEEKANGQFVV
ncbi:hypothetical protein FOXG_12004 [Fusarium oxysporum f. sp. lycopersici 4287]|uniref:CorA-like transporter domain-containing protein n=3 Tax=Fusarium oxysporum TaxID=5507 RepID=A0A0J9VML7_FUSO4|nr:hypothetical protein FOXG_12004 [Fusarium oxysporum f. sp. lycopersici 4287]KNB12399.1 hypothetical protein FOXG_12004 [Fusarium oxysporum f. sp. lycopersici 4287]